MASVECNRDLTDLLPAVVSADVKRLKESTRQITPEAARNGLTVADVQRVITSEVGGANIAQMWKDGSAIRLPSATNAASAMTRSRSIAL